MCACSFLVIEGVISLVIVICSALKYKCVWLGIALITMVALAPAFWNHCRPTLYSYSEVISTEAAIITDCIRNHTSSCLDHLQRYQETQKDLDACKKELGHYENWIASQNSTIESLEESSSSHHKHLLYACAACSAITSCVWLFGNCYCYCRFCRGRARVSMATTVSVSTPPAERPVQPTEGTPVTVNNYHLYQQYSVERAVVMPQFDQQLRNRHQAIKYDDDLDHDLQ